MAKASVTPNTDGLIIAPANMRMISLAIKGNAPLVQHKFSEKSRKQMLDAQTSGSAGKNKSKASRAARDIQQEYEDAQHRSTEGWIGIPAPAFRSAMISACRVAGFQMTKAKLSVFVLPDGFGEDGTPLVRITKGEPELHQASVRLESGVASIAIRPMWREWEAIVNIRFDGDQFKPEDVFNLLQRAGMQVGVGEGRPDSKKSHGMGWGTFNVDTDSVVVTKV